LTNFKHHEAELLGRYYQVELGNEKMRSLASVGYINAVSCTKMFKFIMMYDASLIHPTLAMFVHFLVFMNVVFSVKSTGTSQRPSEPLIFNSAPDVPKKVNIPWSTVVHSS